MPLRNERYHTDPVHRRPLPVGKPLFALVRTFQRKQRADILAAIRRGAREVSLRHWLKPMVETLEPIYAAYLHRGLGECKADIRIGKSWKKTLALGYDVFNPLVEVKAKNLALDLCRATLGTISGDVNDALENVRQSLAAGLAAGEASRDLTARLGEIFAPSKAHQIAATEASRAVHAGQYLMAEESGLDLEMVWLASSDACDQCLELNGQRVKLGHPFAITGQGPYGTVYYPPLHPHCFCTNTESFEGDGTKCWTNPRRARRASTGISESKTLGDRETAAATRRR